jgi:mRNA interferase MazF
MATFEQFSVWLVPFPFTDQRATKRRPAVVLSNNNAFNAPAGHCVMAMITSRGHAPLALRCTYKRP